MPARHAPYVCMLTHALCYAIHCAQVVDMFGAGLPVCAASYSCIQELVSPGETGLLFSSPAELSQQLQELLAGFPAAPSATLRRLQEGVRVKEQGLRWKENWEAVAWPVIKGKRS